MKTLSSLSVSGRRVLVRVDFNVPLDANGAITDDSRIALATDTITYLLENKAKVVLMSHLGDPKGKRSDALSLKPAAERLSKLIKRPVTLAPDCIGAETDTLTSSVKEGEVILLENLRFHEGEAKNDPVFAAALAKHGDCYVFDAFAAAHRSHASVVGVQKLFKERAAGYLIEREVAAFKNTLEVPKRPLVIILGGSKISSKLKLIEKLSGIADSLIIGGAMAYTFFVAKGISVGKSRMEPELVDTAKRFIDQLGSKLILPRDVVIADSPSATSAAIVPWDKIPENSEGFGAGPATIEAIKPILSKAQTILWNGPIGMFENPAFAASTKALIDELGTLSAMKVAGGGDTDAAIHHYHAEKNFSFISSGGGAFLELIELGTLPGIEALNS